ncbi:uncharacterized protein LOC125178387, partial [Hyalella azteca]|uniref:Uncharacterized protein LOC125178387 n=1 Tax=Hyalella azteca TaxID=294128 RepID=A0A979FP45_HYAAZ
MCLVELLFEGFDTRLSHIISHSRWFKQYSYEVSDGTHRDSQSSRTTDAILTDDWRGGAHVHTISSASLASSMATLPRAASLYQSHYQTCAGDLLRSDAIPPAAARGCALYRLQQHSSHACLPTSSAAHHYPACRTTGALNPSLSYATLDHRLQRHVLPPPPPEFTSPTEAPVGDPCGVSGGGCGGNGDGCCGNGGGCGGNTGSFGGNGSGSGGNVLCSVGSGGGNV